MPLRINGKLTFPLCHACVKTSNRNSCTHDDNERRFTGTFVADELCKALELGYKIIKFIEIWVYEVEKYYCFSKSGGLFSEYVNTFLKIKQ